MSIRIFLAPAVVLALSAAAEAQTGAVAFSDLARAEAVDSSGNAIGTLSDVVVTGEGRIAGLLIGQGGVLGIGQTLKAVSADALPPFADGKARLDGQTKESLASLPDYREAKPAEPTASSSPPVSGANQTATQTATVDVPVTPSAVPEKKDTSLPPTPENDAATGQASADSSRAPGVSPTLGEEAAQGSGTGMAPQEGTGSHPTQTAGTTSDSAERGNNGNAPGAVPHLNQQFAREEQPDNQPMPEGSSGRAATDAKSPDASADPESMQGHSSEAAGAAIAGQVWRVGRIVGATVLGDRDGISVKDVRFAGDQVEAVVLSESGQPDRAVPFAALNLGGTADAPKVALNEGAGPPPEEMAK